MTDLSGCGHTCCEERGNPQHDHFLRPSDCPSCGRQCASEDCERYARAGSRKCCIACVPNPPGVHLSHCDQRHGVPRPTDGGSAALCGCGNAEAHRG